MANKKAAKKAIRSSERKRLRNAPVRGALKTYVTRAERLMFGYGIGKARQSPDLAAAAEAIRMTQMELDKAAQKGIIHPNQAARRKSRLANKLNKANGYTKPVVEMFAPVPVAE